MSKAAELAALIGSQSAPSNKNLIINGGMQVAQRGTSQTADDNTIHPLDRFVLFTQVNAGVFTVSQSTDVPSGQGFANSLKFDCTTASGSLNSGDYLELQSRLEGQDLQRLAYGSSGAKALTLSFWVKSNKTGTYQVNAQLQGSGKINSFAYTIDSANTWEKKTHVFEGNQSNALTNDNSRQFELDFWFAAGSDFTGGTTHTDWATRANADYANSLNVNLADTIGNNLYLTGVQLEMGEQATAFEHRSYSDELARCQRYYQLIESFNGFFAGTTSGSSAGLFSVALTVPLRASPSFTVSGGSYTFNTWSSSSGGRSSTAQPTVASYTTGSTYLRANIGSLSAGTDNRTLTSTNGGLFEIDAEL